MNKNRFVKELKDYFSIFASFLIVFVLFSNNMSFAAASCSDIGDFTKREHCRDYGEKAFTVGSVDMDGNRPITCKGVSLDYNPYTSDDYYYDSSNSWCLAWALGISISYSALSVAAGFACTVAGAPAQIGPLTQKAAKLEKLRKVFDVIKKVGQGTVQVAQATALSALTNPVIALQADFAIDAVTIGVILGINIATCAGSLGTAANACTSAAICGGMLAALAAASQTLIFATTGGLHGSADNQIDKVKVCGHDWKSYAYTEYDMQQPENEWYPQYGSFSNSYSYAVDKIIKGEYSCVGYLKDDNGGKDNVKLNADAVRCSSQSSSCKSEINACIDRQKKNNYASVKIDECLVESSSCSAYCKGYFAKCEPIIGILDDGDGVCKDNNGSLYKKDNDKDLFKCKGVKSNYKNARNKFYRESIYKGKEFKISTKYTDSSDCIDPRLDEKKGYAGLEQRYYFRGKEAAQYACSRFKYTNNGCRLSDGTVITQEEAAADPTKDLKCRQAFQDANSCCQNRRALGICIYNSSGDKSDRDNNALCMRSLDGKADNCGLNTGHINNPKFVAYSGEVDSTQICVKNVNYCPYTYNVSGGTELQELYCAGDNNCTDCVKETGDKDDEWEGIKYRDSKGRIKEEYRYTVPLCSDKDTIWKKDRYKYPTMAYGNIKNFCRYRAHCTEIGESDYEFADITSNKFLPKVCSDFVGDSQNLPYPVKVADISMAGSVKSIIKSSGVNIGDGSLNSLYSAIDNMNTQQLATVYAQIMAQRAIISLAVGMVGGSFAGPLAGILTAASAGTLYTIQDIKNAVESDGNAKTTLKAIVRDIVNKPLISGVDFSLGEYRGFTAPIAQCIKETLNNMFLNKAGQSICAKEGESVNSEGLCGNDTFGPPENIRKDAYIQMVGEQLPEDSNIFYKIQTRLQTIIKIVAALAIFVIGLKFLMKGDIDIFDIKKPKAVIVGMLKFAIVFYFAVGNAWQSQFYEWIDKATQYMYYKSFNLSLVGYQDYKNQADKTTCKVVTRSKFCKDYTYQEPVEVEKEVGKERDVCKTFAYTGNTQTFTVPVGATELSLKVWGGEGGNGSKSIGGKGGYSYGNLSTSSGTILTINVGGAGGIGKAGYNGGGNAANATAGGGGGRTDIKINNNLLIVAGGGGGGAGSASTYGGGAGGGGSASGAAGNSSSTCGGAGGGNGTGGSKVSNCGSASFNSGGSINGGNGYHRTQGSCSTTCVDVNYSSSLQNIAIPDGAYQATIEIYGASGGNYNGKTYKGSGGNGGYAKGTITLTNGSTIAIGTGSAGGSTDGTGNGASGGYAASCSCSGGSGGGSGSGYSGAGGGACTCVLSNGKIIMVAGGGGGASRGSNGGSGGGTTGGNGEGGVGDYGSATGGTQSSRGSSAFDDNCANSTSGNGCSGQTYGSDGQGGGGGGGYRGGGGGKGAGGKPSSGGGGGSGYISSDFSSITLTNNVNTGNGRGRVCFVTCPASGAGGGGYGGGASGSHEHGGGGGGGYIGGVTDGGGTSGTNSGNGKAEVCYKEKYTESETVIEYEDRVGNFCDYDITSTENNKLIKDLSEIPSPMPTTSEEICKTYSADTTEEYKKCYSECKTGPDYDENGNQVFNYSDTYDGCYFGDNVYPEGKSYLAIFDSLDCKLMNYFGYGPDVDLPGILHMLLISLIFSPLALVTVILGSILFVILLVIVIKILYLFLMTMIAINIMIYVSPIIFPTLLFEKYKGVFTKWLDNLLSFCLQFVFVIIFAGFLIGNLDRFAIGSARWVGHDRTTGRLPTLVCGDAADSIVCIFQVNTNKGTKPMLGEKIGKFLGIGPVVSLVESISKDFSGTVMTLLKFCLITYVLLEFLKKIPGVAAELTNGTALDPGQLDVKEIMGKIKDTTETVTRGATGALKKGAKSLGSLKKKAGETKGKIKEARAAGEAMKDEKFGDKGKDGDKNGGGLEKLGVKKQDSGGAPKPPTTPPTSSN